MSAAVTLAQGELSVPTRGRGLVALRPMLTPLVRQLSAQGPVRTGLCHLFLRHTSASLLVNEGADPAVVRDLERFFSDLVPDADPRYEHQDEGPDDMPAHVRAALTQTALTLPVTGGSLALGTWQEVFLWEHRHAPHTRHLTVTITGTST